MTDLQSKHIPHDTSVIAMQGPDHLTDTTLYITESALNRLHFLHEQQQKKNNQEIKEGLSHPQHLRISVLSGGCYGFQYKFDFDHRVTSEDLLFTHKDISIIIDDVSYELLKDVALDYVQDLIGAAFTLKNPNSTDSCGCGNSFSI